MNNLFESYLRSITKKFSYDETSEMGYRKFTCEKIEPYQKKLLHSQKLIG